MLGWWLTVRDAVSNVWITYRLGTIFALISMVIVFVTEIRLVREFLQSEHRLRTWPKLLFHTVWRIVVTACAYYGPVWVIETIVSIVKFIFDQIVSFFDFISQADRVVVILVTTGVVLIVFFIATGIAVWQYGKAKFLEWKNNKDE